MCGRESFATGQGTGRGQIPHRLGFCAKEFRLHSKAVAQRFPQESGQISVLESSFFWLTGVAPDQREADLPAVY